MAFLPVNAQDRQSPIEPVGGWLSLLVVELWGIGDLVFLTTLLCTALERFHVTLLAKPHARTLLSAAFPQVNFIEWDAPWTAYTGKYHLWKWHWGELWRVIREMRRVRPDVALSVRDDPRDHLLMRLSGARKRIGFPVRGSGAWLTDRIIRPIGSQHKVEDWRALAKVIRCQNAASLEPMLPAERIPSSGLPRICLHVGARIPVRRWPISNFAEIVRRLRAIRDIHLTIVPDTDGYGAELAPLADTFSPRLELGQLTELLATSDAVICNDSAPGHLAAAVGTPVLAIFGPSDPVRYRPWGSNHHVVIRDICPHRPCFDYCKFPEPYCLTRLMPDEVWSEIERFIAQNLHAKS
jgi:ADP-heptose:LPS heptosyltransferase